MRYRLLAVLFLMCTLGLGLLSNTNLVNYYVNDISLNQDWSATTEDKIETSYIANFSCKMQFVNLNGALRKLLKQNHMNSVIKLQNGHLSEHLDKIDESILEKNAITISNVQKKLEEKDIKFLYVNAPCSVAKYDSQLPTGITHYGNENADYFTNCLQKNGVNYIDLRESMYEDNLNPYDLFYKTDHHWSTRGGFYGYTKIISYLESLLNVSIEQDIKDINSYQIALYRKWHLGSLGQRVGSSYAGVDDFELITPSFETNLLNKHSLQEGSFEELIIDYSPLKKRDYSSRYTYDTVLDNSIGWFENQNATNDKKLLIICDSFAKAVNPYLILSFKEVKRCFAKDITTEFLNEFKPDAVLILLYPDNLNEPSCFSFTILEEE